MRYFGESSLTGKRTINGTDKMKLIRRKKNASESTNAVYQDPQLTLNSFKAKYYH